jgi:hypothetical protein
LRKNESERFLIVTSDEIGKLQEFCRERRNIADDLVDRLQPCAGDVRGRRNVDDNAGQCTLGQAHPNDGPAIDGKARRHPVVEWRMCGHRKSDASDPHRFNRQPRAPPFAL